MSQITVALLSGGISSERSVSLAGGDEIYKALDKNKYRVIRYDPKTDLERLVREASGIDIAFIVLHGLYGEDGTIQGLLDLLGIPYQCSGVLGSALALNKLSAKKAYQQEGLPVPSYQVINISEWNGTEDMARRLEQVVDAIGLPVVVKPACGGSSIGMSIVAELTSLEAAIDQAFQQDTIVLLETYIEGTELTGGVLGNDGLEALPVVEIIPDSRYAFFDYEAKYTAGATTEICPARIDKTLTRKVQEYACRAHRALFCEGYSRTDMIVNQHNELFVLETNTIPGMVPTSLLPLAAKTAGIAFDELLDRLIEFGLERSKCDRPEKLSE